MKTIKFAALCILICILQVSFNIFFNYRALATTYRYARADARDVYFCEKKDLKYALFTIPYTYCVEILSTDGEWYYVKYAEDNGVYRALYGYCLSQNLTPLENPPDKKYLSKTVTVTFKSDSPVGSLPVLSELNVTAAFYGTYYSGASAYSYVLYDGNFGYIYGANDDYPLNEIPKPSEENPTAAPTESDNTKLITALVLGGIAVAALVAVYFMGLKGRYFRPDR